MTLAIQTADLTKRFPKPGRLAGLPLPRVREEGTLAVDRVSLEVAQGEIFGLVGPNGAGKTTLIKMLTTLILPSSGTAHVSGYPLGGEHQRRIKASIGLVTGNERSFYPRLSCRENLRFYAGLHDLSAAQTDRRIANLSGLLDLEGFLDKRYDTCSTGMKHRLALARSLVNSPDLLFLDEPTRSLDPLAAARFRQAVHGLAQREGCTVFLVTHDLYEAADLCDRAGLMLGGQLRVLDAPRELPALLQPYEVCSLQIAGFSPELDAAFRGLNDVQVVTLTATHADVTTVELSLSDRQRALPAVLRTVTEGGGSVKDLTFRAASWEQAFESLAADNATRVSAGDELPAGLGAQASTPDGEETHDGIVRSLRQGLSKPLLFFRRDLRTQMRYRLSFLLQLLGILFSSSSFYFVAQLLGPAAAPQLSAYGGDYFSFVLIGIAFVGYQGVALHTFSGVIQSAQSMGTLEAMLVTPTRLTTVLFSSSLWSFAFTSVRVVIYLLTGAVIFGVKLGQANVLAGAVILALTVMALSSLGILSASFIMVFKRGSPVNFVIGSLSSLLGGVYYPVEVLPGWLQRLARLFPLTYSLEAMRRALLAGEGLVQLAQPVAALAAFSALLVPLSMIAFRQAVRQAKRDGSLTHF